MLKGIKGKMVIFVSVIYILMTPMNKLSSDMEYFKPLKCSFLYIGGDLLSNFPSLTLALSEYDKKSPLFTGTLA